MHKTHLICSLLMAFGISMVLTGCQPPASSTKETKAPPKVSTPGSSTGGGTEVPGKAPKGTSEKPK